MHEEKFLSSWLREDVEDEEERRRKVNKETREMVSRTGKREGEKGENETVVVERRSVNSVPGDSVMGRIRTVVGIRGVTFWVTLVVCLSVCLRCRRVCLL